jgi:5-methylcytosine-specific restriction protein A
MAGSGSKWGEKGGTPRLRGRRAVEQRRRRLTNEPLCRDCKAKGFVRAADVIDHIVPLAKGGPDTDENCQSLCHYHHQQKTAEDFGYRLIQACDENGWPL